MRKMNSRERILTALDHKEPDRIPISIGNIYEKAYRKLCRYLGIRVKGQIPTVAEQVLLIDQRIRKKFGIDKFVNVSGLYNFGSFFNTKIIDGFLPTTNALNWQNGEIITDEYGCKFKYRGVGGAYPIYHPLKDAKKIEDIERYPNWPDPDDPSRVIKNARGIVKKLYEEIDGVFYMGVPAIFHRYQHLRGFNQWLMDMKLNPELYRFLVEKILHINLRLTLRSLNEIGDFVDLIFLNDDMGTTTGPFMSIKDYQEFVKPYYKKFVEVIKKEYPEIKIWYHCHGSILKLIPDIIDCGVNVLNPVLPRENLQPKELKAKFGDKLSFDGAIDIQNILPYGSPAEVREHVKEIIKTLAPNGGFILRAQIINPITPPENICTLYETALEYGNYPIDFE